MSRLGIAAIVGGLGIASAVAVGCAGSGDDTGTDSSSNSGLDVEAGSQRRARVPGIDVGGGPEVVFSKKVHLKPGDELQASTEAAISNNVESVSGQEGARLYKGDYRYDIAGNVDVVLADSPDASTGTSIAHRDYSVSPEQHHGQAVTRGSLTIDDATAGTRYINTVVDADVAGRPGQRIADCVTRESTEGATNFGRDCKLQVDAGDGQLNAVVTRAVDHNADYTGVSSQDGSVVDESMSGGRSAPSRVLLSVDLGDVHKGEILDASASLQLDSNVSVPLLASGKLILGGSAQATEGARVSGLHGMNVPETGQEITLRKEGTIRVNRDMNDMHLNFVVNSGAAQGADVAGSELTVRDDDGQLHVDRYHPRSATDR